MDTRGTGDVLMGRPEEVAEVCQHGMHAVRSATYLVGDTVLTHQGRGVVGAVYCDFQAAVDFGFVTQEWFTRQVPPKSDRVRCQWYGVYLLKSGVKILVGDDDLEFTDDI